MVDAGYGLGRSLGDCGPALPMVKAQTVPRSEANSLNKPMADLGFLFLCWGMAGICCSDPLGFSEAL